MKKIFLTLFLCSSFFISNIKCSRVLKKPDPLKHKRLKSVNATIDFESKVVDYGVIEHNSNGDREFKFKILEPIL